MGSARNMVGAWCLYNVLQQPAAPVMRARQERELFLGMNPWASLGMPRFYHLQDQNRDLFSGGAGWGGVLLSPRN